MTNFTSKFSGLAMLALATLPIAALASGAHAAPAIVKVADLNLFSAQGIATYQQRADAAGRSFCRDERSLTGREGCRTGVKVELTEKLETAKSAQLASQSHNFAAR